jgi:hypothetical protein
MAEETPSSVLVSQLAAQVITDLVLTNQTQIRQKVESQLAQKGLSSEAITNKKIETASEAVVLQDPLARSKRIWAVAAPIVTALAYSILSPETLAAFFRWLEDHPSGWGWVAAQVISVLLVALSKREDVRSIS